MVGLLSKRSGLMDLEHKYKKIIKRHNDESIAGRARAYFFEARKVKERIKELREDVERVKTKFMVELCLNFVRFIGTDVEGSIALSSFSNSNKFEPLTRWSRQFLLAEARLHLDLLRRVCQAWLNL